MPGPPNRPQGLSFPTCFSAGMPCGCKVGGVIPLAGENLVAAGVRKPGFARGLAVSTSSQTPQSSIWASHGGLGLQACRAVPRPLVACTVGMPPSHRGILHIDGLGFVSPFGDARRVLRNRVHHWLRSVLRSARRGMRSSACSLHACRHRTRQRMLAFYRDFCSSFAPVGPGGRARVVATQMLGLSR